MMVSDYALPGRWFASGRRPRQQTYGSNRRKFRRECQAESFLWYGSVWTL